MKLEKLPASIRRAAKAGKKIYLVPHMGAPTPPRGSTLLEADALVNGERAAAYGPWEDNAHNAAKIFCGMTGIALTADDVTKLLIALKWARDRTNPKRDNVTDANGYGELLQKMREGRP